MSKVSSWDGPPMSINRMQFVSGEPVAPRARRLNQSVRLRPRVASAPACRKSRRLRPSQNSTGLSESSRNMLIPPQCSRFYHREYEMAGGSGHWGNWRNEPNLVWEAGRPGKIAERTQFRRLGRFADLTERIQLRGSGDR